MTHYFFHICSRTERIVDREGADFDTLEAAVVEARLAAREILAEDLRKGQIDDTRLFEIFDDRGNLWRGCPSRTRSISRSRDRGTDEPLVFFLAFAISVARKGFQTGAVSHADNAAFGIDELFAFQDM